MEASSEPLSPKEIWEKAKDLNITKDFYSAGKTPWATIGAYLYTDISRGGANSKFIQISERPAQFFLRRKKSLVNIEQTQVRKQDKAIELQSRIEKKFPEHDLYPLLVAFANYETHFKAYLKTIQHNISSKKKRGYNEWLHPDLVGAYLPFDDYKDEILDIQTHLSVTNVILFSFEVKIYLNFLNLREYYFQAVSNSSWANEGYLVVLDIDEDPALKDEIRRLRNAFGIGLIKLNIENIYESEIIFPADFKQEIDWDTVNRLASENKNFSSFLNELGEDIKIKKVKSKYDHIMKPEELEKYILDKKFLK